MARYPSPDTLNTATKFSNYAVLLREMGMYDESRLYFDRALAIMQKKLGADHVMNTECLNEFGALLNLMGRPAEAAPLLERTLAIEEKTYGPDHVDLASVLNNLAGARSALAGVYWE